MVGWHTEEEEEEDKNTTFKIQNGGAIQGAMMSNI